MDDRPSCELCGRKLPKPRPPRQPMSNSRRGSPIAYATKMYLAMKRRVRDHPSYKGLTVDFSRQEFGEFLKTTRYLQLRQAWQDAGYPRNLAPSVDRIDGNRGYSLDNIQIIPVIENIRRPRSHSKINYQQAQTIRQLRKQGNKLETLAAQFGISRQQISHIANYRTWKVDPLS